MSRKTAIVEEFDDDTDLPLPSNPLPNLGTRGPLLEQLNYSNAHSDDDMDTDYRRAGPASPPRTSTNAGSFVVPANTVDSSTYKTWTCVYPIYLDAKRPYGTGQRRVQRAKSLWWPLSKDIADAANRLGLGTLHEVNKSHPRDWENPGRVRVQWKKDGRLVNPMIKSKKQLLETICFQIQMLKPENIPKPPYNLAAPKESSPPVSNGKGKQSANVFNQNKSSKSSPTLLDVNGQKGGRRLPVPPEPHPPLTSRVSAYSPAISTGILVDAVKAGMNNPDAGLLPGAGGGGNVGKGKRKFVRRSWQDLLQRFTTQLDAHYPPFEPFNFKEIENVMRIEKVEDLTCNDVIVVVMGPTGAGKSTFIQTITERHYDNKEVGHSFRSATSEVSSLRITFKRQISGSQLNDQLAQHSGDMPLNHPSAQPEKRSSLVLVDTPGFDDTEKSDLEVLKTIAEWLKKVGAVKGSHGQNTPTRISGILYLHRITDVRISGTVLKNFDMFQKLCGTDFYRRVALVTTMWPDESDKVTDSECRRREKELKENYWNVMITMGSRVYRFTKRAESAERIINEIAGLEYGKRRDELRVEIQKEMVLQQKAIPSTRAGRHLHGLTEELVLRQNNLMTRLQTEMKHSTGLDQAVLDELLSEFIRLREERERSVSSNDGGDKLPSFSASHTSGISSDAERLDTKPHFKETRTLSCPRSYQADIRVAAHQESQTLISSVDLDERRVGSEMVKGMLKRRRKPEIRLYHTRDLHGVADVIPVHNIQDLTQDDLIIITMGPTGAGKPAQVTALRLAFKDNDKNLMLMDTPRLDDTVNFDKKTPKVIRGWLKAPTMCATITRLMHIPTECKSTFIQTVAGERYNNNEVGHNLRSATSQVSALRITFKGDQEGRKTNLVLVDTPGFDDTEKSDLDILKLIADWLKRVAERPSASIGGILYLHRITDVRMSGTVLKNFNMFQKLCGEDFFRRVILTTTMWPDANDSEERERCEIRLEDLLDNYWASMTARGSQSHEFTK
ncbi:Signal recognition particle SEC65 subunit [Leucoagaricus sp. SymC.cos]|nr:Signal recognition particle SEC65 subunit [Leucoagaricus sp. SymC.cos]